MPEQEPQLVILAGPNGAGKSTLAPELLMKPDVLEHEELVLAAMQRGVRRALRRHKALGESIVIERDGQIVTVPPEEIQVDDEPSS